MNSSIFEDFYKTLQKNYTFLSDYKLNFKHIGVDDSDLIFILSLKRLNSEKIEESSYKLIHKKISVLGKMFSIKILEEVS